MGELHQQLKGMSPSTAEINYLDKVKWHDLYGVDLHPVLGEDSVEYFLGLTPSGIVVLRNKTTVAHYYWPRIAKVYFKGRYFMLRVCDKNVNFKKKLFNYKSGFNVFFYFSISFLNVILEYGVYI